MRPAVLRLAAACALGALAGCALRSPPEPPELRAQALPNTKLPDKWVGTLADPGEVVNGWLATFNEPELTKLVVEAMAYNPDLLVAAARVEAAEASARMAGAAIYPQVSVMGRGGGKLSGDASGLQGLGLFAAWELDLWGRVRSVRASSTAQYEAAELDMRYARESIAALIAKSWFLARQAALQKAIAADMVKASQDLAGLSRDRLRVGRTDEYEVATADASVLAYRDLELQADLARQNALRSIEMLAGRYPSAAVDPGMALPPLPGPIPAGLPSQLLERRYDVRAAERRVAGAFYRIQEAQAARLPSITLTASVSTVSSELLVLKERDNPVWGVAGKLLAPIFMGGALEAQVEVRTAEQRAAVADYARVGARAFGEVEGALSSAFNLDSRSEVLARSVQANERSVGYARVRYDVGSGDLRGIQQQMLALHASRTTLAQVQFERVIQRINLHLALGGGFESK